MNEVRYTSFTRPKLITNQLFNEVNEYNKPGVIMKPGQVMMSQQLAMHIKDTKSTHMTEYKHHALHKTSIAIIYFSDSNLSIKFMEAVEHNKTDNV